ncbi:glycosyltransferase [Candidatus Bipolaricaulota bacterium]|nr:glycosyltransferase [Candidatus Bipolaricaulota bacterium]
MQQLKRSVVFLHDGYYHSYYLARALRKRGWDAVSVRMIDSINHRDAIYSHGADVDLFSPDPVVFQRNIYAFFEEAKRRFEMLHVYNDRRLSFFPQFYPWDRPPDIIKWLSLGKKLAYTISGCNSLTPKSFYATRPDPQGRIICDVCAWNNRAEVCNSARTLAWVRKVDTYCDVAFVGGMAGLDYLSRATIINDPFTFCLDPQVWHPGLEIPEAFKIRREKDELLVFHAMGNYALRTVNGCNIKGTHAIVPAVKRLQSEGFPCRLLSPTNMNNIELRFIQAQADVIVVSVIPTPGYGATAREGLMLGVPVVCPINKDLFDPDNVPKYIKEAPLVYATEETIYNVLKDLLLDEEKRRQLSEAGRSFALKWHSADACAERYEAIYDRLMEEHDDRQRRKWARIAMWQRPARNAIRFLLVRRGTYATLRHLFRLYRSLLGKGGR